MLTPESEIRRRIHETGPITFAEFMEVALYWPGGGYYSGGYRSGNHDSGNYESGSGGDAGSGAAPFGPAGDYYTSPLAHPAFGALLAVQLYQFWLLLDRPDPFHLVEAGAGNGQLCRDILAAADALPNGFPASLRYLSLDLNFDGPAPEDSRVARLLSRGLPLRNLRGCVLSNELLDAFPVHQVRLEQGHLKETYITLDSPLPSPPGSGAGGEGPPLAETRAEPSTPALAARLADVNVRLAEGQTAEINLGLAGWAAAVAAALESGFVLTIDYGRLAEELYSAKLRPRGTLVTYYRHTQTDAPLRHVGRQDITAQVDFTSVVEAGRRAGLEPLGYTTQGRFLRNLGLDRLRRRLAACPLPAGQGAANRAGLAALSRPDGLGDFKVLVQGKNLPPASGEPPQFWGLSPSPETRQLVESLPLPLLTPNHISLPQGWPHSGEQEFELTDLWEGPFSQ